MNHDASDSGPDGPDERVLQLVERCLRMMGRAGPAAVDRLLEDHPEHRDAVLARLRVLEEVGFVDVDGRSEGQLEWVAAIDGMPEGDESFPEMLGDFRLLERIGRGGMGVVYRASQESLGRDVALKLIKPSHLYFPGAHLRFRREVEAVARLSHPGIVSIHLVGEEQGIPFFAMDFVRGKSLAQVIDALRASRPEQLDGSDILDAVADDTIASHTGGEGLAAQGWVNACLTLCLQSAEALAHAHERGVLHRDVKPSNIMISPNGRARLLDFGLAFAEGTTSTTRSGAQMGSLPYMAPEQVRGESEAIGPHTDVYALGVTLYECLTLRPPFWGDNAERTRASILDGSPAPIRSMNSTVPWDVETVCQTAMEVDPTRRYRSMQAFVDDLRRLLARQPIKARRSGAILRGRRWAQRNPARASVLAIGCLAIVGGPLLYAQLAEMARVKEVEARQRADRRLNDAIQAVDEILAQGSDADFASQPGTDPARRRMLGRALELYQSLLSQESGNPVIAARVVHAQCRMAAINLELGETEAAEAAARQAIDGATALAQQSSSEAAMLRAEARSVLMSVQSTTGRTEEFWKSFAEQQAEPLSSDARAAFVQQHRRALGLRMAARTMQAEGRIDEALAANRKSAAICEELSGLSPTDHFVLSDRAMAIGLNAYFAGFRRIDPDYASEFETAVALLEKARELSPQLPTHRSRLGRTLSSWAHIELQRGNIEPARPLIERAHEIQEELCEQYPGREPYMTDYLRSAQRLGWALKLLRRSDGVEELLAKNVATAASGMERFPHSVEVVFYRAMMESELARWQGDHGSFEQADEGWRRAEEFWTQLTGGAEAKLDHAMQAGAFFDNLARYQALRGRRNEAERSVRTAIDWHKRMFARTGESVHRSRVAKSVPVLVRILIDQDRHADAVAALADGVDEGLLDLRTVGHEEIAHELEGRADYRTLLERTPAVLSGG